MFAFSILEQMMITAAQFRVVLTIFFMSICRIRAFVLFRDARILSHAGRRFAGGTTTRTGKMTTDVETTTTLEWETFEFSERPKMDQRFNSSEFVNTASVEELNDIADKETLQDEQMAKRLQQQANFVNALTPEVVERATRVLQPYIQESRLERMDHVLSQRTQHTRFLFENPTNPSNVWACLRTVDSFGIQNVDVVIDSPRYKGKAALTQKRGMRTAMGSAQWLTVRNYASTREAVASLKSKGYRLYASDLNPNSRDVRDIDWDDCSDSKICIVMGNESDGISQEMRELADETFTLPMCGFAESFNLSVATAITLAHLSACSKDGTGPLRPGDLDAHEVSCLRLRGILNSLAHKKLGTALLRKEGIELPIGWVS